MEKNSPYPNEVALIYHKIDYYQKMVMLSITPYERMFYKNLLDNEIRRINYWYWFCQEHLISNKYINKRTSTNKKEFTLEELAEYDGSSGRPAYVAVKGVVYDVSLEPTWGGGTHFSLYAGKDLTTLFNGCHANKPWIIKKLPVVGVLKK